jgi:hypothetical protein
MSHAKDDEDDGLTKRFKAVFNKEPVSQDKPANPWNDRNGEEYDVDDDEVNNALEETVLTLVVGKADRGKRRVE